MVAVCSHFRSEPLEPQSPEPHGFKVWVLGVLGSGFRDKGFARPPPEVLKSSWPRLKY